MVGTWRLSACFALLVLVGANPGSAGLSDDVQESTPIVAMNTQFLVADAYVLAGETVTFTNLDLPGHNVVSDATDGVQRAWCTKAQAEALACPLFHSGNPVGLGSQDTVDGAPELAPGVYAFYCQPHPWMVGTLTILEEPEI